MSLPNVSRGVLTNRFVGLRVGAMQFEIANAPRLGVDFHCFTQAFWDAIFERLTAFARVVLMGADKGRSLASFASSSARSLPRMSACPGHQEIDSLWTGSSSRNFTTVV